METKNILKSKTIWMGIIEIAIGLLVWLSGQIEVGAVVTGKGIIDIVLRLVTNQAVVVLGGKKE